MISRAAVTAATLAALFSWCSPSTTPAPPAARICTEPVAIPVDPSATPTAKAVLQYLSALPKRTDKRVVSGQMRRFDQWDWDPIKAQGHTPGLMGVGWVCDDGKRTAPCNGKPFIAKGLLQKAADHFHAGGLVQVDEAIGNPLTLNGVPDTRFTQEDFAHLLTPGDPIHRNFLSQLDVIADGYQLLQEQGVVALVHALPEMNGDWFWWGRGTAEQYKALFRMEFDHLTKTRGLHNLLFTYAPNAGTGSYAAYYPGDAYIDIVGLDYYVDASGPIPKAEGYDELTTAIAPCKPFGLVEFGPLHGGEQAFSPRDYDQLIVAIKATMPKVTYWHSWKGVWGMGIADYDDGRRHLNVAQLLSDPWVVNLGEIAIPSRDASQ
jgi:mannan endo-1,4-beta-mannosidase